MMVKVSGGGVIKLKVRGTSAILTKTLLHSDQLKFCLKQTHDITKFFADATVFFYGVNLH